MDNVPGDAMTYTVAAAVAVSLGTLFRLFQKHIDGQPLIPAEYRRVVPWNALAPLVLLAPLLVALSMGSGAAGIDGEPEVELTTALTNATISATGLPGVEFYGSGLSAGIAVDDAFYGFDPVVMMQAMWGQSALTLTMSAACFALLILAFGATRIDLGLPESWPQFFADVRLGATMWAASLVPIYAIMVALNFALEPTEGHPLVERLVENHSLGMMAAAMFTAVVAAPLYEEAAFRLVLQGWLERVEYFARRRTPVAEIEGDAVDEDGVVRRSEFLYAPAQTQWLPIAVSGTLFGLAHWGHGVSPVPLVLLGFILGYAYQRTHRIVPCITCHVMFNGFTFLMLALQFAEEM
jgi:membrane protease YdiL (CAAX protease family)